MLVNKRGGNLAIWEFVLLVVFVTFFLVDYPPSLWRITAVSDDCKLVKVGKFAVLFNGLWIFDKGEYVLLPLFVQVILGYAFAVILTICGIIAYSINYLYMINNLFLLYLGLGLSGVVLVIDSIIFIVLAIKDAKAIKKSKKNK